MHVINSKLHVKLTLKKLARNISFTCVRKYVANMCTLVATQINYILKKLNYKIIKL